VHFKSALSSGMKDKVQVSDTETAYQITSKVVFYVIYSFRGNAMRLCTDRAGKCGTVSLNAFTGVLISPSPDREGNKLQRQKILMFIYPI
jgi:hypothetical protein